MAPELRVRVLPFPSVDALTIRECVFFIPKIAARAYDKVKLIQKGGERMAKGDVIYIIREMKPAEHRLVAEQIKASHMRIIWQQFADGFPSYRHYGVDIGDGTVVHFRGRRHYIQACASIQRTPIQAFGPCDKINIAREVCPTFPPDEIANRALSMVGTDFGGYNFLTNNCEHFANWCACGRRISQQVMFRKK